MIFHLVQSQNGRFLHGLGVIGYGKRMGNKKPHKIMRFFSIISGVVPTEGFEPPRLATHGPEPCASTNSATWAYPERMFLPVQLAGATLWQRMAILAGLAAKSIALRFPVKSANMALDSIFRRCCPVCGCFCLIFCWHGRFFNFSVKIYFLEAISLSYSQQGSYS